MRWFWLALLLSATPAAGQSICVTGTAGVSFPVGTALSFCAEHDVVNTDGYRVFEGSTLLATLLTVPGNNVIPTPPQTAPIAVPLPPLAVGVHVLRMVSFNAIGEAPAASVTVTMTGGTPPPPPVMTCPYTPPGGSGVQQRPLGDVISGLNQIATQATRWPLLLSWGWKITAEPASKTTVDITATCVGPK